MAIQTREEIIAKLNNAYGSAPAQSKPAYDFADHVRTLLEKVNPKGNMLTDAAAYYADPFRKKNAIDQAILDEELAKKKAEEEAAKAAVTGGGGRGMFNTGGSDGNNDGTPALTQEQIDFLGRETPEERYARITGDWFGLKPMGAVMGGGLFGLSNSLDSQVPTLNSLMYNAAIYNKTPDFLKGMLPESYQKANERISEYNRIMNGVTPYEDITPIFDIPGVTPYEDITPIFDIPGVTVDTGGSSSGGGVSAPSSDGYSATGDGSGGYSAPTMSDPYGGYI